MPRSRVAIIGDGHVGSALKQGLERAGHEVKSVGKDPQAVRDIAGWGDVVILAVPFAAMDATIQEIGSAADGKPLVDPSNALTPEYKLALGCTTSGAEELQKKLPQARVVKAFNTVFAAHMATGKVKGTPLSLFVAGDDEDAKDTVLRLGRDIGFDPVNAGPLENARWLETLGFFNIQLGFKLEMGTQIGFRLIH